METAEFVDSMIKTTACTARLMQNSEPSEDEEEILNDLTPSEIVDEASLARIEESRHGSDRLISPPVSGLGSKQRCVEGKPSMISKLRTEQTDSQQSLSTNSREFLDEETAV